MIGSRDKVLSRCWPELSVRIVQAESIQLVTLGTISGLQYSPQGPAELG